MKLNRFLETLLFFDVIPFLNCWQKILGKNNKTNSSELIKMNKILVTDTESNLTKLLIQNLLKNNYQVKLLTRNVSQAHSDFDSRIEVVKGDIFSAQKLDEKVWEDVDKVICLNQENLDNFIEQTTNNLPQENATLFNFQKSSQELKDIWGAVDDVVMGGISESNFKLVNGKAIFSGVVSTENNGGFASVRTKNFNPPWNLSAYEGIQLRVQGDGKRYKFITRCEGKWDGIGYCYSFDTLANSWITINIPFDDLIPVFRAKTVHDADKFDSSKVYSLQLMLSKFEYDGEYNPNFQAGAFTLEVESVKVYGNENIPQLILLNYQENSEILNKSNLNFKVINNHNQHLNEQQIIEQCLQIIS